jgi:sugar (pentulose or hexulose) kinase
MTGGVSVYDAVVGVDSGTLSGRAVVVRVAEGEELGAAVHKFRHGVMDRTLAATGAALRRSWRSGLPATTSTSLVRTLEDVTEPNPMHATIYEEYYAVYSSPYGTQAKTSPRGGTWKSA